MNKIILWLSEYGAEYNQYTKVLFIRYPMPVKEFVFLKKLIKIKCQDKVKDIKVGL